MDTPFSLAKQFTSLCVGSEKCKGPSLVECVWIVLYYTDVPRSLYSCIQFSGCTVEEACLVPSMHMCEVVTRCAHLTYGPVDSALLAVVLHAYHLFCRVAILGDCGLVQGKEACRIHAAHPKTLPENRNVQFPRTMEKVGTRHSNINN